MGILPGSEDPNRNRPENTGSGPVHARVPIGFFFGPADLGSGLGPTRDLFGYPKYPQIIVYIWVIDYIFGISDFFKVLGSGFRV